jgi:hypothetical protein
MVLPLTGESGSRGALPTPITVAYNYENKMLKSHTHWYTDSLRGMFMRYVKFPKHVINDTI